MGSTGRMVVTSAGSGIRWADRGAAFLRPIAKATTKNSLATEADAEKEGHKGLLS